MSNLDKLREWMAQRTEHKDSSARSVFVVGLGRFGASMATSLVAMGVEVMAIDTDEVRVNQYAEQLTHVRLANGTSTPVLRQLGAEAFDAAVVAIGTDIEASILTAAALADLGMENIWAKAITNEHGRILERVGAHHVVFPEKQMGQRVARMVTGQVLDYFHVDEGFALAELKAPPALIGRSLGETEVRSKFSVTVVCVKPAGGNFTYATADTRLGDGDLVLVAGSVRDTERFAHFANE